MPPIEVMTFKVRSTFGIATILAISGIAITNVVLVRQNTSLKTRLEQAWGQRDFEPGERFPHFAGVDLDGRIRRISFEAEEGKPLAFIYFSPFCAYSQANLDGWLKLSRRLEQSRRELVWISQTQFDATREYCLEKGVNNLVLSGIPYDSYRSLGLSFVPKLITVNEYGIVERVWKGSLTESQWKDVFEFFVESQVPSDL